MCKLFVKTSRKFSLDIYKHLASKNFEPKLWENLVKILPILANIKEYFAEILRILINFS